MAWFEDGSPCTYFDEYNNGVSFSENLKAVGWLSSSYPVPAGSSTYKDTQAISSVCSSIWITMFDGCTGQQFMGVHECELCDDYTGGTTLFIPDLDSLTVWCAPKMILHYVEQHDYLPPKSFCCACRYLESTDLSAYINALEICGNQHIQAAAQNYARYLKHSQNWLTKTPAGQKAKKRGTYAGLENVQIPETLFNQSKSAHPTPGNIDSIEENIYNPSEKPISLKIRDMLDKVAKWANGN